MKTAQKCEIWDDKLLKCFNLDEMREKFNIFQGMKIDLLNALITTSKGLVVLACVWITDSNHNRFGI